MTKLRAICMPKWGIEMTEGTIAEWMVAAGDNVARGDVICLIETDKITNEVEAEADCVIQKIVEPARDEAIAVGTLLAVTSDELADDDLVDSFVADFVPAGGGARKAAQTNEAATDRSPGVNKQSATAVANKFETNRPISPKALALAKAERVNLSEVTGSGRDGRITHQDVHQHIRPNAAAQLRGAVDLPHADRTIFASPLAHRLGAIHNIDLCTLTGTGPRGRISKKDVLAVVEAGSGAAASGPLTLGSNLAKIEEFDKFRKVVAKRLTAAKRDIPHFYLRISFAVDKLMELRRTANMILGCKASINDYIVMAAGRALAEHPDLNIQLHGEQVHKFPHADIAIAVASPKGLVTPIMRQVDRMRIDQVAQSSSALIAKAKEGRLSFEDMAGGTFTVSNLGMFGIEEFDAIINPPQGAILAVGQANRVMTETDDGGARFETQIKLTLSVDHRAIDGAAGAQFLNTLKDIVENPEQLFSL